MPRKSRKSRRPRSSRGRRSQKQRSSLKRRTSRKRTYRSGIKPVLTESFSLADTEGTVIDGTATLYSYDGSDLYKYDETGCRSIKKEQSDADDSSWKQGAPKYWSFSWNGLSCEFAATGKEAEFEGALEYFVEKETKSNASLPLREDQGSSRDSTSSEGSGFGLSEGSASSREGMQRGDPDWTGSLVAPPRKTPLKNTQSGVQKLREFFEAGLASQGSPQKTKKSPIQRLQGAAVKALRRSRRDRRVPERFGG